MNERLKELAKQSAITQFVNPHNNALIKFAKLLIKECADVARKTELEDVEGGDGAVLRAAGDQIEKHFGIE